MLRDLAERLRHRGLAVELGYGGDISLVASHGRVAVAVETDAVLSRGTLRESLRLRPAALRRLGWHYVRVHTFELFADPEAVAARIAGIAGLSSAVTMEVETLDAASMGAASMGDASMGDASTGSAPGPVEAHAPLSATEAIDAAIESRRHAQGDLKYAPWHFYLSPACPAEDRAAFANHAKEVCAAIHNENPKEPVPDFSFEENGPSFPAHLKTCKAAILRAGLSSAEAALMGRPTVVVPYVSLADTKEESEQYRRAQAIAQRLPFVRLFDTEHVTEPKELATALSETYAQRHVANHENILGNGHNHAAEAVMAITQGKQPERLTGRQP
jgi:hypothetical protein